MRRWIAAITAGALSMVVCLAAHAQVTLPPVQVPTIPNRIDINRALSTALETTNPERLRDLRKIRIDTLVRTNRTILETDPRGAPIIRSEVVAVSPSANSLQLIQSRGFEVMRSRELSGLDLSVVVLRAPPRMSTRNALRELRRLDPGGSYDFNHIYLESGESAAAQVTASSSSRHSATDIATSAKLGLIDGGIDRSHEVFRDAAIRQHGCNTATPSEHGTAIASLMMGRAEQFHGAAPGAELYAADVYCGAPTGGSIDAVAEAFAWLSQERVSVINISLVGPANAILEQVVRRMIARGHIVVAAVGNDGPSAPPLYPAAYPGVVAVTAVDARRKVLIEACRGRHVLFAAPGTDMVAASIAHPYSLVRGTSFAAPIVAGLLVSRLPQPDRAQADAAIAQLVAQAIDLGSKGPDKIYGNGLVGDTLRMPTELAKANVR